MDSRRSSMNNPPAPTSADGDEGDSSRRRPTRARIGPLPKNSPDNPLFPPLPPKMPRQKPKRSPHSDSRRDKEGSTTSSLRNEWLDGEGEGDEDAEEDGEDSATAPLTPTPAHTKPVERLNNVTHDKPNETTSGPGSGTVSAQNSASAVDDKEDEGDWASYARRQRQSRGFGMGGSKGSFGSTRRSVKQEVAPVVPAQQDEGAVQDDAVEAKQDVAIAEEKRPADTEQTEESQDIQPGTEETAGSTNETIERPPRVQRMASLASSVLTMDNEEEEGDIEMEIDTSSPEPEPEPEPQVEAEVKTAPEQVVDPVLDQPTEPKEALTKPSIGQGRKPSTSSSNAIPPNMDLVKKTRRSSKIDVPTQEEEKPPVGKQPVVLEEEEPELEPAGGGDITRCVCTRQDIDVMMISCDGCDVWQHGACVGIWGDEEAPDEYFCELCRPNLHAPLQRYMKLRWKNRNDPFVPPTPADLQHHTYPSDRIPPSQSKRWLDSKKGKAPAPPSLTHKASNSSRSQRGGRAPSPINTAVTSAENRKRNGNARSERQDHTEPPPSAKSTSGMSSKRRPSMNRRQSSDSSEDSGPLAGTITAKKRSTMNSRDAAYEAAIRASLAETGRASPAPSSVAPVSTSDKAKSAKRPKRAEDDEDVGDDAASKQSARGIKRSRGEDGEEESEDDRGMRKGKKKKDGEEEDVDMDRNGTSSGPSKAKHPNQYTYRPKPGQTGNPIPLKVHPSPQKKPPTAAEARKFANATARAGTPVIGPVATSSGIGPLSWGLPDHLIAFSHVLPTATPEPLELMTPRPSNPKAAAAALAADPLSEERQTHYEQPSKVKYPGKRMTVGEMKKRVRSVLEYVGRIQVEEVARGERAKMLGLEGLAQDPGHAELGAVTTGTSATGPVSKSMQMMDDLTRDLIKFQEIFEGNGQYSHGQATGDSEHGMDIDR